MGPLANHLQKSAIFALFWHTSLCILCVMARTVPTTEPIQARAGDTWEWTKDYPDYPASTWTLSYVFYNSSGVIQIAASADGDTHTIDVAPATTTAYTAGRYDWTASVTDGTDVYQVGSGVTQVLPDLSSATSYDGRSHARVMLDAIDAILESRASAGDLDLIKSARGGRSLERGDLIKLRNHYAAIVRQEEDAQKIASGQSPSRLVQVRFTA